ncbi:MAG: hypothetical protein PVI90_03810, partial [Desulfobacteraceae bacterium]
IGYGTAYGYTFESYVGYVYSSLVQGSIPLYRYYSSTTNDHFYTTNWEELGQGNYGYTYEGITGYVHAAQ